MKSAIKKVSEGKNLSIEEAADVMNLMLSGEATQAQIAAYLTALRMKGETIDEIIGSASVLKEKAAHIHPNIPVYADFVGTGGDCTYTFNISTTAAFVAAAAGLPIAKHGNRAISSKSGAGDVLEALGVNITPDIEVVEKCVEEVGIGFMFAPAFNKSMRFVGQVRSEIGIRSIFNILGPMANPSGAKCMIIGVYDQKLCEPIANALMHLGVETGMVVSGENGMDEISTVCETTIAEIKDNVVTVYQVTPEQFGFKRASEADITGGDGEVNAQITRDILSGKDRGPKRDIVLLNAGMALYAGKIAASPEEGIRLAAETIDSGKAAEVLDKLVEYSNR
ncbi:MAG: anthranilate phosphoribosyltransferase [Lachnospiraceae bacterium]|nr:anthranilate phosphoribosyltransferase [Lachnospiraceae bacterium]